MPETQWMTLRETANMMKTLPEQVTQMCEDGKLEYYMEDGRYFVSRESIDLFMHPPIGQPAPANPDSNGTPRRQYGRAPHDIEPSPKSASDSQAVNSLDKVGAAGVPAPEDRMVELSGRGMEETPGRGDEVVEAAVDAQPEVDPPETDDLVEAEVEETAGYARPVDEQAETAEDLAAEGTQPVDDLTVTDRVETAEEPVETVEDAQPREDLVEAKEEQHEEAVADPREHEEAVADPGEPDVRVAEILADLRAALSRHAREHKAFCDEIAGLADALESTLSRDDDKTSELTREISSLLARYTRR